MTPVITSANLSASALRLNLMMSALTSVSVNSTRFFPGLCRTPTTSLSDLESVRFLLEHCARRGRPLAAGAMVLTGAVTGVHRAYAGDEATCAFKGVAELKCRLVAAEPRG